MICFFTFMPISPSASRWTLRCRSGRVTPFTLLDRRESDMRDQFPQHHFGPLGISTDELIRFRKSFQRYSHQAEALSRPSYCLLCGKENPSFCNSHSVPQFCLRKIALNGEVHTSAQLMGCELFHDHKGVKSAGTFRMICKNCDSSFFSSYESEGALTSAVSLNDRQMGQIALKTLLLEQFKELAQLKLFELVQADYPLINLEPALLTPRALDLAEDREALRYALDCIKGEKTYRVLFDELLDHTSPIAFQGRIALASGFNGEVINWIWDMRQSNQIANIFFCVFPTSQSTRVLLFCDRDVYSRFAGFANELNAVDSDIRLKALIKVMFAYSEEVYLSPWLPDSILNDTGLKKLASMSGMRVAPIGEAEQRVLSRAICVQHAREFGINNLPDIPNLLNAKYSMQTLKAKL